MPETIEKAVALEGLKKLAQRTQAQVAAVAQQVEALGASVPAKVSDLTNDSKFQTDAEVSASIQTAIAASGHAHYEKASAVPDPADAQENTLYLVMNAKTKHYDIYAKIAGDTEGSFTMERLDDTTVDLSGYVEKAEGKGLSANDYTDADKAKVDGLSWATDAEVAAMLDEVFGAGA